MKSKDKYDIYQKIVKDANGVPVKEEAISYEFVAQAFLTAYIKAWEEYVFHVVDGNVPSVYLVIEEINRGNCAQIFGDLFQLLDRNDEGFSDYAITADKDIAKFLRDKFAEFKFEVVNHKLKNEIACGEKLVLPPNLFVRATMNTSDQSLFPIDSAFKRRWDWKYVPIHDAGENYKIEVGGECYDWWDFVSKINGKIFAATSSEDKQLGYFFCKATTNGIIDEDKFVGKVLFYLWNDVFKDYGFDDEIFEDKEDSGKSKLVFTKFYAPDGSIKSENVKKFLENLDVKKTALTV